MNQFAKRISCCLAVVCLSFELVSITNTSSGIVSIHAFPTGAGACVAGRSSVSGSHKSTVGGKKVTSSTLTTAGLTITIDGTTITEGGTATVKSGTAISIKVSGKSMKGINMRIGAPSGVSTKGVLTAGSGLKSNSNCKSPVVGVTQSKSTSVTSYSSTIKFPSATTGVTLDITTVFNNNKKTSSHAYGKVTINFT